MEGLVNVPETLIKRRAFTDERLGKLIGVLNASGAAGVAEGCACVYATGSGGRGEMSGRSDLDIFIVQFEEKTKRPLTNLNEIILKARLIEANRKLEFEDFSGDGEYVKSYDAKTDLIDKLGTREDDYKNILTARLLLLLESRPVLNAELYAIVIDAIVANYWRDYVQNSASFLPVFLFNDILRFWKTLCLNYEERTGDARTDLAQKQLEDQDPKLRGKRRLHNYKLKYSRMLTCYSAIIYLMAGLKRDGGTVHPQAAMDMAKLSPTLRLEAVAQIAPETEKMVETILISYSQFLQVCDDEKAALQQKFSEADFKKQRFDEARGFGTEISNLLHFIGKDSEILRFLVV